MTTIYPPPPTPRKVHAGWRYAGIGVACALTGSLLGAAAAAATIKPTEIIREVTVETPMDITPCVDALYASASLLDIYAEAMGIQTDSINATYERDAVALGANNDKLSELLVDRDREEAKWESSSASCIDLQNN